MMSGLVAKVSYDQNSHVAADFDYLDLKNTFVPLMMLSTSLDADINGVASHGTNINASGIM